MKAEENSGATSPPPPGPSLWNIRWFLAALLLELALPAVYFALAFFLGQGPPVCELCPPESQLAWAAKNTFMFFGLLLLYLWWLVIPLAVAPLAVGLALDSRRMSRLNGR
jgi:hypothetical protein